MRGRIVQGGEELVGCCFVEERIRRGGREDGGLCWRRGLVQGLLIGRRGPVVRRVVWLVCGHEMSCVEGVGCCVGVFGGLGTRAWVGSCVVVGLGIVFW